MPNASRVIVGRASAVVSLVVLGFGVLLIAGLGQASHTPGVTDDLPRGFESTRAAEIRDADARPRTPPSPWCCSPATTARSARPLSVSSARPSPISTSTEVEVPQQAAVIPSKDGKAAISILSVQATGASAVSDAVKDLRHRLDQTVPDGVDAEVTGPAAIQADLAAVFDGADFRLLAATAGVVAILLVFTYRSPVLWIVPLLVVGIADQAAAVLATQTLAGLDIPWDESTTGILSVLVFGAGTDYALLLISRYRDELREHR